MTIDLGRLDRRTRYILRPVYAGTEVVRPAAGGLPMPIDRTGDHWAIEIERRALATRCGQGFMADLIRGKSERLSVVIPQIDLKPGIPGQPRVNGAGLTGSALPVDGLTPHFVARKGMFLNIVTAGRRYTHIVTAQAIANASGAVSLPIWPMLRGDHQDNDVIDLTEPRIEGRLIEGGAYETGRPAFIQAETFTIEESD